MPLFLYVYSLGSVQPQIHFDDVGPRDLHVLQKHVITEEQATKQSLYSLMEHYPFDRANLPKD